MFEGLDRSGKSTQCQRLVSSLQSARNVKHMRFPNRTTPIGQMINNYLAGQTQQEDHVIHLLFSANRWESAPDIESLIAAGATVVVDRYYYSGCVYSAAKRNPSMDLAWCRQPEVGLPRPDLCIFLDLDAEEAAKRGGFGEERYEKADMQARVRGLFAEMRTHADEAEDMIVVDAKGSVDEVESRIAMAVRQRLEAVNGRGEGGLRRVRAW